jgi:hypothetical protein
MLLLKLRLKLNYDLQSVGQSVLVSGNPLGPATNFFFPLEIFFRQLRVCYFVAPSLTRGRVCNLLLMLDLASAVPLWSESCGTQDHISLSRFLGLLQPGGPGPRIYIPQEQGGPNIPPGTGFPFRRLLRLTCSATEEVFYPASTWDYGTASEQDRFIPNSTDAPSYMQHCLIALKLF